MRVLVVTTVHHPEDSRIRARQIEAMLAADWQVTYAAPFTGYGVTPSTHPNLRTVDVARATGLHRTRALLAARRLLRAEGRRHDVVLVHDPELLAAVRGLELPHVVWDVHEDTAASVNAKPWLPRPARRLAAASVRSAERWAEPRVHMILAEPSYQSRFEQRHLVVPNTVRVPATVERPGRDTVVHIGSLTAVRGAHELIRLGNLLRDRTGGALTLRLIGSADVEIEPYLQIAAESGAIQWDGYLPSRQALAALRGALAGVCLLHPVPNYLISMPTKVLEYMAHGVPVVSTPLPLVTRLVESAGSGVVVPYQDPEAAADAILRLRDDAGVREQMGAAGHAVARLQYDWGVQSAAFLTELARVADPSLDVQADQR